MIKDAKQILISACPALETHHFLILNSSRDLELMAILKAKCNNTEPLIAISLNSHFIGDLDELKKYTPEQLLSILNEKPKEEEDSNIDGDKEEELSLGVLDQVLNVTEFLVSGVSTLAFLPVTGPMWALSAVWTGLLGSRSKNQNDNNNNEKHQDIDFEVIHTNWYWRHLKRIFRFTDTKILRLHPKYLDNTRAAHEYNSVSSLELIDPQNLIISYNDSSPSDYIRSKPSNILKMMKLILQRTTNPEKPIVINKLNLNLNESVSS